MIRDMNPELVERQAQLALWLLVHAPQHTALTDLKDYLRTDEETLRHDLNLVSSYLYPYKIVVDPTDDQKVGAVGQESNIIRAVLDLLNAAAVTGQFTTHFSITDSELEPYFTDRIEALTAVMTVPADAKQKLYNYLWTVGMRYRFGHVKRPALASYFTPAQLALISEQKESHPWSQQTIDGLDKLLPENVELPIIEDYLLTLRVWLYTH
ncbi:hypothetical protein [Secundilactobacillus paracollinoides]|uniref:Mga helix-turn-helix domain-containing protein n=1 Tax=Secundilactobacillus paracollinoides TaxID=240427 RepID=A0A1B2IYK5_9LACO|nr:hypothetical protein [Secundilactobacillus paracollinoides]ANZ61209.1 hypothetical protein AYR61_07525 [Secundilactobacillus paracollinoides]ANZ67131.1 hypothetical protein AYR63_08275 [Secundilactobacillus paracollinoides]